MRSGNGRVRAVIQDDIVAFNIKQLCDLKGWTQDYLAIQIGVARSTISRIECGGICRRSTLERIAATFGDGTTVERLLNRSGASKSADGLKPLLIHRGAKAAWYAYGGNQGTQTREYHRKAREWETRHRLGVSGHVPLFGSPIDLLLPWGMEILTLEVYDFHEKVHMPHLRFVSVYGVEGGTIVEVGGMIETITPGESIAFHSPALLGLRPADGDKPSVVLLVGSTTKRSGVPA